MTIVNTLIPAATPDDTHLLPQVVAAVQAAGCAVRLRFNAASRPADLHAIGAMIAANDAVSLALLRPALAAALPGARWDDDEGGAGPLAPGAWWVVDPVEGAINHIHGLPDWGVTATLVRDNVPVLTAVHLPLTGATYTAVRGGGAWVDGQRLCVSQKADLHAAMVGTGQAAPGEGRATWQRLGMATAAMLEATLVVRVSVPATLQLLQVAAGRQDLFWQHSQIRSGLLAGALLVAEAGGSVTDLNGMPWRLDSRNFLAGAPALVRAAVAVLAPIAGQPAPCQELP
jgi:myo-inositol-1(or 4)-monophosphatase